MALSSSASDYGAHQGRIALTTPAHALALWERGFAIPVEDDPKVIGGKAVQTYLKGRRLWPLLPHEANALRMALVFKGANTRNQTPALLAPATPFAGGDIKAVQYLRLTYDGDPFTNERGAKARLTTGPSTDCVVRLDEPKDDRLGLAEGLETAMSVSRLFIDPPAMWATLGTLNLKRFVVPRHIRRLYIFYDHDENERGQSALGALTKRLRANPRPHPLDYFEVSPAPFNDFNDKLRAQQ